MPLDAKDTERLARAVEGRNSQTGHVMASKAEMKSLMDAGLVEQNEAIKEGSGATLKFATRASDAGMTAHERASFKIEVGVPMAASTRKVGERGSKYPFDDLPAPQMDASGKPVPSSIASFHVPKTADMPDPVKSMQSSVTTAKRRYSQPADGTHKTKRGNEVQNYTLTRDFRVKAAAKDDPAGPGARIFRIK